MVVVVMITINMGRCGSERWLHCAEQVLLPMYPRVLATVPTARSVIRMMMMMMMRMMVRMVTVLQRIQRTSALADLEQYGGHNDGFQDLEDDAEEKIPSQRKQRIRERMKEEEPERERQRHV